jgi:hypothetical protein
MIFNASIVFVYEVTRTEENYVQSPFITIYNDGAFSIAVSPSVMVAVPTVLFRDTLAAFLGFQGESSLCRVRCQIPLQRANRLVRD